MTATTPVCPPPAIKGAASAVAAPAAPALGVGTRFSALRQSGAGMLFTNLSFQAARAGQAERRTSRAAINFGGCVAPQTASVPDGNHGDNFPGGAA